MNLNELIKGKTYWFGIHNYDIEKPVKGKGNLIPYEETNHYNTYIGKFVGNGKGKEKHIFILENFRNQENINTVGIRKEIKFFRLLHPSIEEVETPKTEVKRTKGTKKTSSKGGAYQKKKRTTRRRR